MLLRLSGLKYQIFDLGRIDFIHAWNFQKEIFLKAKMHLIDSAIVLCEHDPVITIGRGGSKKEILASCQELNKMNIKILYADRGGKTTYHGPGQLVVYFIFNLNYFRKDLHYFLRWLEKLGISFLNKFNLKANSKAGLSGIWIDNKKIASIGICVKNWITYHGMSINVKKDVLDNFYFIRPCGMDIEMTSIESILGQDVLFSYAKRLFLSSFKEEIYG
ncbi:MAG: lipoyl(octanoyl) transferase LipB [Candidatus Omnitrophica bacterium]|nr:lipoyl(octanoyl) transferase LipB [Candidatus Omnitrophota bacterium]